MTPDDFEVGLMVTVLEWEAREHYNWLTGAVVKTSQDNSWVGDVLRIEAINLPFLVCRQLYSGGRGESVPFKLDTRRATMRKLNDEYVQTLLAPPHSTEGKE